MKPSTRDQRMKVSTAMLATTLYKRGLRNQLTQDVHPLNPGLLNMAGKAFTLRYMPARDDFSRIEAFGVMVIPARLAEEGAAEATEMTAFEDLVQEKVIEGRSINGLYPPTAEKSRTDIAAWRTERGR